MSRFFVLCSGVLATVAPLAASAATITIDTFTTPSGQHSFSTTGAVAVAQAAPGALGGRRELDITRDTGAAPAFDKVTVTQYAIGGTSFLDFDQTSGAEGSLELTYDSPSGNLNADFSINRKVLIDLSQFNDGEGSNMTVTVEFFDGVNTATAFATTAGNGAQTLVVDFTSPSYAVDFSSINAVSVFFNAPLAGDFRVTSITAPEAQVVPEPVAFAALGLGALIVVRRRP